MGGWVLRRFVVDCSIVRVWEYDPKAPVGSPQEKPGRKVEKPASGPYERKRYTREEWVRHLRGLNGIVEPGQRIESARGKVQDGNVYYMSIVSGSLEQALCGLPYDERTYMTMELDDTERRRRFALRPVPWVGKPLPSIGSLVSIAGQGNSVRVVRVAYGYPGRMKISG